MASQLRVNKSENRSGLGTITYTDTGAIVSGIVTANSFSGDIIGDITGAVTATTGSFSGDVSIAEKIIHTGDTNTFMKFDNDTVTFETAGYERLRIKSDGKVGIGTESPSQVLTVRADSTPQILLKPTDATPALFVGDTIRTGEGQHLAEYRGNWDGTTVGRMVIVAGDDTGNKDNGEITFNTASAGSTIERLRIKSDGKVLVGSGCTDASLFNVKGSAGFADDGTNAGLIISTDDTNGAALSCLTAGGFVGGSYGVMRLNALQHKFTYGNTVRLNIKSDGNIETDGNLKTNNITGKNLVINGSFQVDQRNNGAELSISSNTKFSADRWTHNNDGHTYYKTQRKNDGPIQTIGTEYYMRATITTALSQGSGNNSQCIENNLEGNTVRWLNLGTSGAKQCTLSFWVRCSLTGTFGGALVNSGYNRCHPFSYTVSSANTWEYKTFTFATTGFTSGNFDTGTGVGLRLVFSYGNGTGRQASADQWHNGVKFGPTGETCLVATNGATLDLASVQLEEGTQATRFDHKSYAEELRLCQRYYYRTVADNNKFFPGMGMADIDGNTVILNTQFPVRMRSAPSALEQTGTASDYKIRRSTTATCTSAPSFGHATLDQVTTNFVKSSHGWGDGSAVRCMGGTSGAYLGWSAEL